MLQDRVECQVGSKGCLVAGVDWGDGGTFMIGFYTRDCWPGQTSAMGTKYTFAKACYSYPSASVV